MGDPMLDQPVGQPLQVGQHRRVGARLLGTAPPLIDDPDGRHGRPLMHVDGGTARVDNVHPTASCLFQDTDRRWLGWDTSSWQVSLACS